MGVHESTMRAAVADLVPAPRRGFGYGVFGAIYGLAWLGGAAAIGALYDHSVRSAEWFVLALQLAALFLVCTPVGARAARGSRPTRMGLGRNSGRSSGSVGRRGAVAGLDCREDESGGEREEGDAEEALDEAAACPQ